MQNIAYIGEHLLSGQLGTFFIHASFVFIFLSSILYLFSIKTKQGLGQLALANFSFRIHSLFLLLSIGTLFYMLLNQYFEYHYVWQHSSKNLPLRYIFSCFWEGQEGSFILWMFWHVVLGNIIIQKLDKNLQAPVLFVFSVVQLFISTMVLGIYIGEGHIGSNPFGILLREHPDFANMPLFTNPEYLKALDGRGLNPLLQNYWMTIHPPTLFLGFASVTVPFAFAAAALIKNEYAAYVKKCIPWAFFSIGILAIGILMGGAWAYEALSFGGFWAWDPVENASLVPWLILVGGAHLLLIYQKREIHLRSAIFFILLSFIAIIYSTFLTRSGILGETSVHAFVDLGLNTQLLIFLLFFIGAPLVLFFSRFNSLKTNANDTFWSKEFWMFMGSVVLLISAIQMTFSTSLPVINKLLELLPFSFEKLAPSADPISHYHKFQVPLAIVLAFCIGIAQMISYKKQETNTLWAKFGFVSTASFLVSVLLMLLLGESLRVGIQFSEFSFWNSYGAQINYFYFFLLVFGTLFAVFANIAYAQKLWFGKVYKAGSSIAHAGFLIILLGALISMGKQQVISLNTSRVDVSNLSEELNNGDHILLYKNDTLKMDDYYLSYRGMEKEGVNIYYQVDYYQKDENKALKHAFTLFPRVQTNPRMGNVSEPDTRHFLHKDIYTHVTYALLEEMQVDTNTDAYANEPKEYEIQEGDTFFTSNAMVVLESINKAVNTQSIGLLEDDIAVGAFLSVKDMNKQAFEAKPIFVLSKNGKISSIPSEVEPLGLKFAFPEINPEKLSFKIQVFEKNKNYREFIVMKAIVFPWVNLLWTGCILLFVGTMLAVYQHVRVTK